MNLNDTPDLHASEISDVPSRFGATPRAETLTSNIQGVDFSKEEMRTYINAGDEFEGNLVVKGGIRVKGVIRGSVRCEGGTVLVEQGGHVTGSIESKGSIYLDGLVGVESESEPRVKVCTPGGLFLMNMTSSIKPLSSMFCAMSRCFDQRSSFLLR